MKTISNNIIKIELNESEACHLYELLKNEIIVNYGDVMKTKVYMPTLDKLKKQIREQMISENYYF